MNQNSMIVSQVIGLGAAGNKAAINLVEKGVIDMKDILLINSTNRDIPPAFMMSGKISIIGSGSGGCGQERERGKELCVQALQSGQLNLEDFIRPDCEVVFIISSTEGGTGSGASVVISHYIKAVLNVPVIFFAVTGFEQEPRSIWNTIGFFKDLKDYHMEIIRNKNFLVDSRGNHIEAEKLANDEIAIRYQVLTGQKLVQSTQNIDARDLKKLIIEPGWGNVEYRAINERIKNSARFNEIISDMIDESKSMDSTNPAQKKMGVMINLPEKDLSAIDYTFNEAVRRYGVPYEVFKHIQNIDSTEYFICIVSTGRNMPIEELELIYQNYADLSKNVNQAADEYQNRLSNFTQSTNMFDMTEKSMTANDVKAAKQDFFSSFNFPTATIKPVQQQPAPQQVVKEVPKEKEVILTNIPENTPELNKGIQSVRGMADY